MSNSVSTLLSAISVFAADSSNNKHNPEHRLSPLQLTLKLRPYLLALKQLEQVYVVAHWIRSLFMKLTSTASASRTTRPQPPGATTTQPGYGSVGTTFAGSSDARSEGTILVSPPAVSYSHVVGVEELGGGGDVMASPYFPMNGDLDNLWTKLWMNVDIEDANAQFRMGGGW